MSKKTHFESIEAAKAYVTERPEIESLTNTFIRMSEYPKVMCKIQIGAYNADDELFTSKLTSNIRFTNILFSFLEGEPIVYIRNQSSENVVMYNLTGIEKITYAVAERQPDR